MSFTNKPSVSLTLDQVLEIVDQLSTADKLKVAKRMQEKERNEAIDDLVTIFSKVKLSAKAVSAIVEEERTLPARWYRRRGRHGETEIGGKRGGKPVDG